jgi:hypothetical protein
MYVIYILGFPDGAACSAAGLYVRACDVDAHAGRGKVDATPDIDRAMQFPDAFAAYTYLKRASTIQPLRDDGKPNRPLTAYTVELVDRERGTAD